MSGAGDFLFGSEGAPAEAVDTTPQEFRDLREPVSSTLRNLIQSGGGQTFGGPFAASPTPEESQILSDAFGAATQSGLTDEARQNLSRTIQGDFLSPESNPFLQETIQAAQRPVVEQFQDVTLPRLRGQFTQAGQFVQGRPGSEEGMSSPFDEAVSRASRSAVNELGDISTNITSQNFQQERQRQASAAEAAPQFERAELDRLVQGLQTQALPRMVEQMGIDRGLEEFRRRMDTLLQAIGISGDLSQAQPATFEGTQPTTGFIGEVGPGVGQAAATAILSDRRLKTDVRHLGTRTDGIGLYFYRLFGQPQVGVMADEVEQVIPSAVGERDGYATVDYAQVF